MTTACADRDGALRIAPEELRGEISTKQPAWLTTPIVHDIHEDRGTVKVIADELGVPEKAVYGVADRHDPKPLKAAWIPVIVRVTGSFRILDALEAQVGRVAFVLPSFNPRVNEMHRELARTVREFGDFLTRDAHALADGRLEPHEVKPLVRSIDVMLAGLSEYRALVVKKAQQDAAA